MSEPKITKEVFEKAINSIVSGYEDKAKNTPLYDWLQSKREWFDNPEHIDIMLYHEIDTVVRLVATSIIYKTDNHVVGAIYTDYGIFEHNLSRLCSGLYGSACSVDKSRHIIRKYIDFAITKECPEQWEKSTEYKSNYWIPNSGTPRQWFDLVEGICSIIYGRPDKYILAYGELLKLKEVKP